MRTPVTLPKLCTAAPSTAPRPVPGRSRDPQVGDVHAQVGHRLAELLPQPVEAVAHRDAGRARLRPQGVDLVAERGELLGDAVVDVAGDPVALLEAGELAQRAEQQTGLQGRGDAPGHVSRAIWSLRIGERPAVRPLRHDDGRRPVAQREGHDEGAASARARR